jgi:cell division transport system permease protein
MSLGYILKEGIAGFGRAKLASFTSVFSLFIASLLIGVLFRIGYNAYEISQELRRQVEVEVFLDDIGEAERADLEAVLLNKPEIEGLNYISKDSASAVFMEQFGTGAETIADLAFLPASYRVTISDGYTLSRIDSVASVIGTYQGVDEVRFNMALLQQIEDRTETLVIAGAAIGIFILLVAMVLVFNTIRLTIYAKRNLIRAMKLVGATHAFIRRPFLVEGVLQGMLAGGFAAGAIYLLFEHAVPAAFPQIGVLSWPYGRWYFLLGGVLGLAVVMGWFGSRWSARRFIKSVGISS